MRHDVEANIYAGMLTTVSTVKCVTGHNAAMISFEEVNTRVYGKQDMNYDLFLCPFSFLLNEKKKRIAFQNSFVGLSVYTTEGTVIHRTPSISHGKNLRSAISIRFQIAAPFPRRRKRGQMLSFQSNNL